MNRKVWLLSPLAFTISFAASGQMLLGADGHEDQGGPYTSIPLSQQAKDLHTMFGNGTVLYRDFGDGLSPSAAGSDVPAMQKNGVQPILVVDTYPPWGSFANQQVAYNWGYQNVAAMVQATPTAQYYEIGNEWSADSSNFPSNGNRMTPGAWTSGPNFQKAVAVTAAAIAAIRRYNPNAKIIGGANGGWTQEGFPVALAQGLRQRYPGLMWDYTVLHWYGNMGDNPGNFDGGQNAYSVLNSISKPIAVTEFGSKKPQDVPQLLQNFKQNGVALATAYELYEQPEGYGLYSGARPTAQGQAVQSWVANSGGSPPGEAARQQRDTRRE
jgi:hypothetical protein